MHTKKIGAFVSTLALAALLTSVAHAQVSGSNSSSGTANYDTNGTVYTTNSTSPTPYTSDNTATVNTMTGTDTSSGTTGATDTSGSGSSGTTNTTTSTTPGLPNTGAGGAAASNLGMLLAAGFVAVAAGYYALNREQRA